MPLTDTTIRNAKPAARSLSSCSTGAGFIWTSPSGGKWWRLKYRYGGKEKRLSLGVYPDVSLKDARARRDEARKLLANGVGPSEYRKSRKSAGADRTANSFEAVAREWFAKYSPTWVITHASKIIQWLENDVFPWLGGKPIAEIAAPEVLTVLRRIENRGALDTAHRAHQNCGQIFRLRHRHRTLRSRPSRRPARRVGASQARAFRVHHGTRGSKRTASCY